MQNIEKLVEAEERGAHDLILVHAIHLLIQSGPELLNTLRPVEASRYSVQSTPTGCLHDTRVQLLKELTDWATDLEPSKSVFWLGGLAGTGKSAIMRTTCERLAASKLLGASLFVS
jgi:hypothetical protein